MGQFVFFLSHYLRNPKAVGALSALSPAVAKDLLKFVKNRTPHKPCKILEVGAGTGSITRPLAGLLREGDKLDVIEIDEACCQMLEKQFQEDSRVCVHNISISIWEPDYKYDFIISTLPFNTFSTDMLGSIINLYRQLSADNGMCAYVEYMALQKINQLFSKEEEKKAIKQRRTLLKKYHEQYLVEKSGVFKNFLPCHVYHLQLGKHRPASKLQAALH